MAPSFAPSSSTYEYEVFVSFRGAENRTGFTSHLFAALDRKTIYAYKDDRNLPRGEKIGPELLKAIETSRIAVVVFSKNYATSDWCLDELVKIMECKRVFNQRVLPIFYHVSQPEVLEQKGNFAELPNGPEDKMNSWRAALTEAANLEGLHLEPNRPESEFIEEIVENILKILKEESSTSPSLRQNDAPGQHSSATIPHNDASSGLDLENYSWTQTLEEVTLNVTGTKSSSVVREIKGSHLKLGLKGQPPIIDWELFRPVKPDDCSWRIEDQSAISTLLTQHKMEWRKSIVKGDPEIDTQKVEPESSKLSDPDPETRQTVEKDNSVRYKNLLQELAQKEGFSVSDYDTNRSGEVHAPIFVSTVEIEGEVFKGHEARTKKQAEMNAAKIAYTTLKERKSGQGPLIVSPAHKGKETPEISSSSLQPNVTADLQQLVGATMNLNLCTIAERQAGEDRVSTEVSLNQPSILSSGPDTIITCNRGSSVDASYGYAPDTLFSTPCKSENGLSSHSSTNLVMDSSLVQPAETIISSCKRIFVHPRLPNMTIPKGYTILPKSDDKWVAFSPN